jgi:hypothetical protein
MAPSSRPRLPCARQPSNHGGVVAEVILSKPEINPPALPIKHPFVLCFADAESKIKNDLPLALAAAEVSG